MNRLDKVQTVRAVGLALLGLLLLGLYLIVLGPRLSEASTIRTEVAAAKDTNAATVGRIDGLKASVSRVEESAPFADRLAAFFPPDANQKVLFTQIKAAGAAAGIPDLAITSVAPGAPAFGLTDAAGGATSTEATGDAPSEANQIASQSLNITADASKDEALKFLARLENLDRSFLISSVNLQSGEDGSTVTINGLMFMLPSPMNPNNDGTKVPEDIPAIPGAGPDGKPAPAVTEEEQALIGGLVQAPA